MNCPGYRPTSEDDRTSFVLKTYKKQVFLNRTLLKTDMNFNSLTLYFHPDELSLGFLGRTTDSVTHRQSQDEFLSTVVFIHQTRITFSAMRVSVQFITDFFT